MESCMKHPHERAGALCGRCGTPWCATCLVYAYGPTKPPLCMPCAMYAGGVRTAAVRPAMPKRQMKSLQKAAKAEAKARAKAGPPQGDPALEPGPLDLEPEREQDLEPEYANAASAVPSESVAVPTASDWERPWWEDRQPTFAD